MISTKPVYLLAGGRGGGNMDSMLDAIFDDIGRNTPTIAYIGAANGDNPDFFERMAGMLLDRRKCHIAFAATCSRDADPGEAIQVMTSADAVFVAGGDVEAGMNVLDEEALSSAFPRLYEQGKLFFGVSAGSIMLAREWVRWTDPDDDSTAELFPCLGVAPLICDTHGEGDGHAVPGHARR